MTDRLAPITLTVVGALIALGFAAAIAAAGVEDLARVVRLWRQRRRV